MVGCQDPTRDSGTSGSTTTGNTTISDSTYNNSGDFLENWDAYANGEMKVITITYSASSVSIDGTYDGVTITADGTDSQYRRCKQYTYRKHLHTAVAALWRLLYGEYTYLALG